ncbi:hypothetical protein FRC12_007297 [Ceratobasidium sp. 428]|nr:hypothetical protein FRC12_007297 [Ceratobasidium sp. 428]
MYARFITHLFFRPDVPFVAPWFAVAPRLLLFVADSPPDTHLSSNSLPSNTGNASRRLLGRRCCWTFYSQIRQMQQQAARQAARQLRGASKTDITKRTAGHRALS